MADLKPALDQQCPSCGRPLSFEGSSLIGKGGNQVQEDKFECFGKGCGTYIYNHRDRKLRKYEASDDYPADY